MRSTGRSNHSALRPEGVHRLTTGSSLARRANARNCNGSPNTMAAAPGLSSSHSSSVNTPAPVAPTICRVWAARAAARSAGSGSAA
ncbi:MAG: hypothetical protein A2150_01245 [Candidatus Muproteobacteria bacterium RBG_16_64_11]|uniref:Uncharacterized protein n=1 Tax=Candidatus Muproteobacteria bacterium RBG_16_64_11 TaxID=1817758 RepID=A0A1F6TIF4_9PROT|nr:MAG: hypothetical protein A2150_01245 [Candidatus Muproteobacteria bacterium RBG_16_64_11]